MIVIKNWKEHLTIDRKCYRCGLSGIPEEAIQLGGVTFEKEGRFLLTAPRKFEPCDER